MKRLALLLAVALVTAACGGGDGARPPTGPTPPTQTPPPTTTPTPPTAPVVVLDASARLSEGFELLVNTNQGRTDWLSPSGDGLRAAYPGGQLWGFIAGVVASSSTGSGRPNRDYSSHRTLLIDLRGANGGESVQIGIKDSTDPDDGTETRKTVTLTTSWQPLSFPLRDFTTADLTRVYLLFELVFNGPSGQTVFVRNVQYVP